MKCSSFFDLVTYNGFLFPKHSLVIPERDNGVSIPAHPRMIERLYWTLHSHPLPEQPLSLVSLIRHGHLVPV